MARSPGRQSPPDAEKSARCWRQWIEGPRVGSRFRFAEAHRGEERRPDLGGLPSVEDVALQAAPGERVVHQLGAREPLDERRAFRHRQHDRAISRRIADYRRGVLDLGNRLDIVEKATTDHDDAAVARGQIFLRAIGDAALPDPGYEILIHRMTGNPGAGGGVCDRPLTSRDAVLDIGLTLSRHAAEMPHDAERVFVVDGHAELDVIAAEQSVRPQADPADRPQAVMLARIGADALVLKSVLEFAEIDLDVLRRVGARDAAEPDAPVRVGPFEMHRVNRVFLALEPIAWNLGLDDLAEAVLPREEFPVRHERPRLGTEIGP